MNVQSLKRLLLLASTLLLTAGLVACSDDDTSTSTSGEPAGPTGAESSSEEPAGPTGAVRVVHGSFDAGPVDIWVNGDAPAAGSPLAGIAYGEATAYLDLPVGDYTFDIAAAGTDTVVASISASLTDGLVATALAYGGVDAGTFDTTVLVDDLTSPGEDSFRLTFVHGATNVGPVDIRTGGDVVIPNADLGDSATLDSLPAADYDFDVHPAGSDDALITFSAPLASASGLVLAVAVGGIVDDASVQLLAVFQDGTSALLDPSGD